MTPSKEKKALPSSSSSHTPVVPDQPTTYLQWQTALQQVKVQYLQRQYKRCASRCTQLLTADTGKILALHKTFLHFYAALCYEALSRSTHNLSAAKLSTLHLARESYEAAAASLPRPTHLPATNHDDNDDDNEEGDSSASFSDTASSTSSSYSDTSSNTPSTDDDESPTSPHTTSPTPSRSPPSSPTSFRTDKLKPSPLRIRKKAVLSAPTPTRYRSRPQLAPFSPLPAHATYHYTTHLISFATMLQTHIHAVDALLHHTSAAAQTHGRRSGACSDGGGGNGGGDEERSGRIERLRATGWKRERFVPSRYEELCARALAEL